MQDFRLSQWLGLTMCQMVNSYRHFQGIEEDYVHGKITVYYMGMGKRGGKG